MDQSASVFSEQGSALFVSFSPSLSARPVFFPKTKPELVFVIAQSLVTSNKQVTGPIHYNLRVVEVSIAAAVLNAKLNAGVELPKDAGPLGVSLRGFHSNYFKNSDKSAEEQLLELVELTKTNLDKEDGYTGEDIAAALGSTVEDVKSRFLSSFPVRADKFKLRQRALHVFTEALRVLKFMSVLEESKSSDEDTAELNRTLGNLMNETQDSCRELYQCSCPEIDELCAIAREAGTLGSRLTGAGWGGASVHLVAADKVDAVKKALVEKYYSKLGLGEKQLEEAIVVSRPMSGSAVVMLENGAMP
jgi:galactokinase